MRTVKAKRNLERKVSHEAEAIALSFVYVCVHRSTVMHLIFLLIAESTQQCVTLLGGHEGSCPPNIYEMVRKLVKSWPYCKMLGHSIFQYLFLLAVVGQVVKISPNGKCLCRSLDWYGLPSFFWYPHPLEFFIKLIALIHENITG